MYKGITENFRLVDGAIVNVVKPSKIKGSSNVSVKTHFPHFNEVFIEAFKGPEFEKLGHKQAEMLVNTEFTISKEHSRMAYQLDQIISNKMDPIITSLVLPGTVQLTPSGKLIVLMRDCQTTGGYPRILQLNENGINRLSQKNTGQKIRFLLRD